MEAKEIFEACVGLTEEGENKAAVRIVTSIVHRDTMEEEQKDEIMFDGPVVDIFQSDRLTIVNLKFDDSFDTEFLSLQKMIQDFQTFKNSVTEKSSPIISLAVMPKEMEAYYLMGVGGIAFNQSNNPGEAPDTVSFIFTNDTFSAYLLDTSQVAEELEKEADA